MNFLNDRLTSRAKSFQNSKGIFLSLPTTTVPWEGGPSRAAGVSQGDKEQCVLRFFTLWGWAGQCEVSETRGMMQSI